MKNFRIFKFLLIRIILKILIFSLIFIFLFKLINVQNNNIEKQKELEEYEKKLAEAKNENKKIKNQIENKMNDENKEKLAREELNMVKAGEMVIYDVTKD